MTLPFLVNDTIYNDRLSICEDCEYNDQDICSQCSCFILAKAKLKRGQCPIEKWLSIATKN